MLIRKRAIIPSARQAVLFLAWVSEKKTWFISFQTEDQEKWFKSLLGRVFIKFPFNPLVLKKSSVTSEVFSSGKPWHILMFHILLWLWEWFYKCCFIGSSQISCKIHYDCLTIPHFIDKETVCVSMFNSPLVINPE